VLWRCWLGGRKGIRLVKNWVVGCWHGYLGWGAVLHIAQQMPLPLTISCSSKSRLVLTFLVLPFWYLLNRVVPDRFQQSSKTVVCVCGFAFLSLFLNSFCVVLSTITANKDEYTNACSWGSRSIHTRTGRSWSRRSWVYRGIVRRRPHRPDPAYHSHDTGTARSADSRSSPRYTCTSKPTHTGNNRPFYKYVIYSMDCSRNFWRHSSYTVSRIFNIINASNQILWIH